MSVTIRKVEEPVYDGSSGAQVDTHTRYEIGGEIDGTFVPFANVRESYVTHLQDLDKRQKEKEQAASTGSETTTTSEQTV
jgi:hypothetical protein